MNTIVPNLQIVISLLNAQSDFPDHPSAPHPIQESRERMQAIAIIHQKLYQQRGSTLVNMYISLAFQPYYADNYVKEAAVSNTIS